jgi:hypothetical protein
MTANEAKKLISSSRNFLLLFLREKQLGDELVKAKESLEGCIKEKKLQLEESL